MILIKLIFKNYKEIYKTIKIYIKKNQKIGKNYLKFYSLKIEFLQTQINKN